MSTDDLTTGTTESTESTSTGDPETTGTSGGPGEECGDGVVDPELGEECDDGPENHNNAACTGACKANVCGDHFVHVVRVSKISTGGDEFSIDARRRPPQLE